MRAGFSLPAFFVPGMNIGFEWKPRIGVAKVRIAGEGCEPEKQAARVGASGMFDAGGILINYFIWEIAKIETLIYCAILSHDSSLSQLLHHHIIHRQVCPF